MDKSAVISAFWSINRRLHLPGGAIALFLRLVEEAFRCGSNPFRCSTAMLADELEISRRRCQIMRRRLVETGIIAVDFSGENRSLPLYRIDIAGAIYASQKCTNPTNSADMRTPVPTEAVNPDESRERDANKNVLSTSLKRPKDSSHTNSGSQKCVKNTKSASDTNKTASPQSEKYPNFLPPYPPTNSTPLYNPP